MIGSLLIVPSGVLGFAPSISSGKIPLRELSVSWREWWRKPFFDSGRKPLGPAGFLD